LKNGYQLVITERMSIILGFGGKEIKFIKTTMSPYVADLHGSMTIYVYCNIVQPHDINVPPDKIFQRTVKFSIFYIGFLVPF
jgi:hypothetical protein